jgi:hypothetical protein
MSREDVERQVTECFSQIGRRIIDAETCRPTYTDVDRFVHEVSVECASNTFGDEGELVEDDVDALLLDSSDDAVVTLNIKADCAY